jgi:putative sterol carrier protein
MLTIEDLTRCLADAATAEPLTGKSLKIDLGEEGLIRISGSDVDNEDLPADCTIHVTAADLQSIAEGDLDPTAAFMSGKLRVDGDLGVAMAIQPLFGRAFG